MKLNNKGLTLIELLISIVLVGIVLAFLFQILMDLKDETDNNDFAFNNQVNRLEAVYAVERDLIEYNLVGIEDVSTDDIIVNFYFRKGGGTKTATLSTSVTPGSILSDDKYYIKYTSVDEVNYTWLMKGASIDPCGTFTYLYNSSTNSYYFHLNLYLYNSIFNARNYKEFNNTVDDIEISHTGNILNFASNNNYLTNSISGEKQIGNCTN